MTFTPTSLGALQRITSLGGTISVTNPAGPTVNLEIAVAAAAFGVFNVKDYGAVGNGITDDTTAIQNASTAAVAAGGGLVWFPPGTYKITAQITMGGGRAAFGGSSAASTILLWPNDLGAGNFCFTNYSSVNGLGPTVDNLTLQGPIVITTTNQTPANMMGIYLDQRFTVNMCEVKGFYASIYYNGDHCTVMNSRLYGSWYSILRDKVSGRTGDNVFFNCDCTGPVGYASLAVTGTDHISGDVFEHVHLGFTAYGIWGEANISHEDMVDDCTFIAVNFEQCGNEMIGCNSDRSIHDNWFYNCQAAQFGAAATHIVGKPANGAIEALNFYNNHGMGEFLKQANTNYASAAIYLAHAHPALNDLGYIDGIRLNNIPPMSAPTENSNLPLQTLKNTYTMGADSCRQGGALMRATAATITANYLLMDNGAGLVRHYDASVGGIAHRPVGVASMAAASSAIVPVATSGEIQVNVASGTTITPGLVKPDPSNVGAVVNATSLSDIPIVGQAVEGGSGPGIIRVMLIGLNN